MERIVVHFHGTIMKMKKGRLTMYVWLLPYICVLKNNREVIIFISFLYLIVRKNMIWVEVVVSGDNIMPVLVIAVAWLL